MVEFIESDNMCIIRRMRNERKKRTVWMNLVYKNKLWKSKFDFDPKKNQFFILVLKIHLLWYVIERNWYAVYSTA